jgi:acetamidase/formamidase
VLDLAESKQRITVPLQPMLGRVAVAPEGEESFDGMWPGNFGGNMDASDVREGATVYLPIFHDGALFYFGDGHALQGDGEICGSGLETTMDVTLQFELIKGKKIAWPRIENEEFIMTVGSVRPLSDALRIASVEMVEWVAADYGFDKWDAYQVVSQLTTMRIANMVDPNYSVVVKMPKKYLPARRKPN